MSRQLTPIRSPEFSDERPSNRTRLACWRCNARASYIQAHSTGWTFDKQGPAFAAFYCPTCTTALVNNGEFTR